MTCPDCRGTGSITMFITTRPCTTCKGTGNVADESSEPKSLGTLFGFPMVEAKEPIGPKGPIVFGDFPMPTSGTAKLVPPARPELAPLLAAATTPEDAQRMREAFKQQFAGARTDCIVPMPEPKFHPFDQAGRESYEEHKRSMEPANSLSDAGLFQYAYKFHFDLSPDVLMTVTKTDRGWMAHRMWCPRAEVGDGFTIPAEGFAGYNLSHDGWATPPRQGSCDNFFFADVRDILKLVGWKPPTAVAPLPVVHNLAESLAHTGERRTFAADFDGRIPRHAEMRITGELLFDFVGPSRPTFEQLHEAMKLPADVKVIDLYAEGREYIIKLAGAGLPDGASRVKARYALRGGNPAFDGFDAC